MKFNMFSKNKESVSSSEHTANKKNQSIYENRGHSRNAIVENDMVKKSLNYTERYNMYKGFVHCKSLNTNNGNCFAIFHNSDVDNFKKNKLEDYHLSRVDYFDLDDVAELKNPFFPFRRESHNNDYNDGSIPYQHTLFNPVNSQRKTIIMKNFKYGHSMSNLK